MAHWWEISPLRRAFFGPGCDDQAFYKPFKPFPGRKWVALPACFHGSHFSAGFLVPSSERMTNARTLVTGFSLLCLALLATAGCGLPRPAPTEGQPTGRVTVADLPVEAAIGSATLARPGSPDATASASTGASSTPSRRPAAGTATATPRVTASTRTPALKATMASLTQLEREPTPSSAGGPLASATPGEAVAPGPLPSKPVDPPGTIGRILIPALGIGAPVVEVSWHLATAEGERLAVWATASQAAGHHRGTAPFGGGGNCVISGHSRAKEGGVFHGLWELTPGDAILLATASGERYEYAVETTRKVLDLGASLAQRRDNATCMAPSDDARLTLITCWPDWAYTHRIIVVAGLM